MGDSLNAYTTFMKAVSLSKMNPNEYAIIITMVSKTDKDNLLSKPWILNNNGIVDKKILGYFNRAIIVSFRYGYEDLFRL